MSQPSMPRAAATRPLISSGDLDLAIVESPKGIGAVIGSPESKDLIAGVRVQPFSLYPDDRGYFLEVQRIGNGLAAAFPPETTQISAALSYPGTMKAFHFHLFQHDCWTPVKVCFRLCWRTCGWVLPRTACATPCTSARCARGRC